MMLENANKIMRGRARVRLRPCCTHQWRAARARDQERVEACERAALNDNGTVSGVKYLTEMTPKAHIVVVVVAYNKMLS